MISCARQGARVATDPRAAQIICMGRNGLVNHMLVMSSESRMAITVITTISSMRVIPVRRAVSMTSASTTLLPGPVWLRSVSKIRKANLSHPLGRLHRIAGTAPELQRHQGMLSQWHVYRACLY